MSYAKQETILKIDNICMTYGSKKVLRDINLEVKNIVSATPMKDLGQVITLLGKSGVGKSQLLKITSGLIKPTSGSVTIGLKQTPVVAGAVGMVLQHYPLFPHRTLMQNLLLVSNDKEKIESYLHEFDIYQHKDKYPKSLSGGQKQRTAILQQLLCSENFILLDEPFSGLDPIAIDKLCGMLTKIVHSNSLNTIIISSHILEPSLAISDTIWMIGHEYDEHGNRIEGAVIRYTDDLAAQGLAWNHEIRKDTRFHQKIEHVRELFHKI